MLQVTMPLLEAKDSEYGCSGVLGTKTVTEAPNCFLGASAGQSCKVINSGTFQGWEEG